MMMKLLTTFVLGLWLYFSSFLSISPAVAAITTSQTKDQVETVDNKNSLIELTYRHLNRSDCPDIISDCPHSRLGMSGIDEMHGAMRNSGFKNKQVLSKVQQFLVSIPDNYYTVKKIDTLKTLAKEKQALLVDVREPEEYASGHIKGAINIPLRDLTQNLNQIPKNHPVILYCSTGYRTAMGVIALQMLGYSNVRGFPPSFEGWKAAGEQIEE
ncbi:Rhodanese-related sulfurtransferase [Xenococcus sp. PCC 7305]|uniref:rhodanese-like domain-containing protein n=1 Tax=Xenococcus sp. PCC 7305 TaxID=102125 RepID=UPI0002ABF774|nr:rhodanese-like domain-containing protein [Xenococcus sp. PCC 7305]ELS00419.1 Rhodanese-related sulfurtransferase [Xenococcus sp. PCC 7305]